MTMRGTLQNVDMGKKLAVYTIAVEQMGVTDRDGNNSDGPGPVGTLTVDARSGSFNMTIATPDGANLTFVYSKEPWP